MPEDGNRELVRAGEVLPPAPIVDDNSFWRRSRVRAWGSALFLLGIAGWLGQNFFQLRGYVNLLASRIDLYCAAGLVACAIWIWARNAAVPKFWIPLIGSILIFAIAVALDLLTLPLAAPPASVSAPIKEKPPAAAVARPTASPKKPYVFPSKPLELLMFVPFKSATLQNLSNETLFVTGFATSSVVAGGEDSMTFSVGEEIKPYGKVSFDTGVSTTWDTLASYDSDDWGTAGRLAVARYKQCVRPLSFLPDSLQVKQLVNHYRSMNMVFPVGDAKGTISYLRGSDSREEVIDLKAILFLQRGCTPQ
jgi:hypothetical protein